MHERVQAMERLARTRFTAAMSNYLVMAGTGKTGRRVAAQLAAGGHGVRVAARHPGPGGVHFDWDDPATHGPALAGVDGVYLVPPPLRLDFVPLVEAFLDRVREAGVPRVVLLTVRGIDQGPPSPLRTVELMLEGTDLEWSIVRPPWFMQNFTEGVWADPILADGVLAVPAGEGRSPFIDAEDIAAVAVAALTQEGHAGRAYDLSGPEALSWGDAARIMGAALGREVAYVDADPAEWEAGIRSVLGDYGAILAGLFVGVRAGADAYLSEGVVQATGREPGSFEAWAAREVAPAARRGVA